MTSGIAPALGLTDGQVETLLVTAGRAPSLHNSQPWCFAVTAAAIELYAERSRALPVIDPTGREMRIACGAALFNLRLALHGNGIRPLVTILPDAHRPDLLAAIRHGGRKAATPELLGLLAAVPRRRTDRCSTADSPPSPAEVNALRRAAVAEGAWIHVIDDEAERAALLESARRVHDQRLAEAAFRAELDRWTTTGPGRDDGVPAAVGGPLPIPSWPPDDGSVRARSVASDPKAGPVVAVVLGQANGDRGDVQAGQALQRVLLTATVAGLGVSFVPHVVQVRSTREELGWLIGGTRPPQAVLQVRRGLPSAATARRPIADLVRLRPAPAEH
jgi:nitroreductase